MKILFVTAPSHTYQEDYLNVFLQPLAGAHLIPELLRELGCEVDVVLDLNPTLKDEVLLDGLIGRALTSDAVFLSATSFNWGLLKSFAVALKRVRRSCSSPVVVVGGVHATLVPHYIATLPEIDVVVPGEGESVLSDLVASLQGMRPLRGVEGIIYRDGAQLVESPPRPLMSSEELGRVPVIQWTDLAETPRFLPVQTSRGCRMNCAFCSVPFRKSWRPVPLDHILRSIESALKKMPGEAPKSILFGDDCFTADTTFAINTLEAVRREFPDVALTLEARINDLLRGHLLEVVKESNIQNIQVGVECGYDEGLRKIRKALKTTAVWNLAARAQALGISAKIRYSYVIGFPWEDLRRMMQTVNFAYKVVIAHGGIVQVNWWLVVPGNSLFRETCSMHGFDESIYDRPSWHLAKDVFLESHPWLTEDAIDAMTNYCGFLAMCHPAIPVIGSAFNGPWFVESDMDAPLIGAVRGHFRRLTGKVSGSCVTC